MNYRHNMVWLLAVAALSSGLFIGGCGKRVQRNPSLIKTPDDPIKPAEKGFLTKAADTTWNVVTAPVRLVAPKKKPLEPQEPEVYEPAPLLIVRPGANRMVRPPEPTGSEPAATAPSN